MVNDSVEPTSHAPQLSHWVPPERLMPARTGTLVSLLSENPNVLPSLRTFAGRQTNWLMPRANLLIGQWGFQALY